MLAFSLLCFTLSMHTFHHCYLNGVVKVSEPKPKPKQKFLPKRERENIMSCQELNGKQIGNS